MMVKVIWIGVLLGSSAMAQQPDTTVEQEPGQNQLQPLGEEFGETSPKISGSESESDPLAVFSETSSTEGICLDGGTYGAHVFGPSCAVCGGGSSSPPTWYTKQNVRLWARGRPRRKNISSAFDIQAFTVQNDADGNSQRQNFRVTRLLTSTRSMNFDPAAGWDMAIGHYLGRDTENRDHFFEFGFSGFVSWQESLELLGTPQPTYSSDAPYPPDQPPTVTGFTGNLMSPFREFSQQDVDNGFASPTALLLSDVFNRANRHTQFYSSDIDDFQMNLLIRPRGRGDRVVLHPNGKWRRECTPGEYVSYVFGMRVISVDEQYRFSSSGSRLDSGRNPTTLASGEYRIKTYNDLIGLQFGGDWLFRDCKWTYGLRAKMGPMINFSNKSSQVHAMHADYLPDPTNPLIRETTLLSNARKNSASLLGEFGVMASYKVRPNLTLAASYDFMWLVGLALAPEQLHFAEVIPIEVNANGHIYYHGLTLGAEFSF